MGRFRELEEMTVLRGVVYSTWRRVVDQGQSFQGHHRRMCTKKTDQFHIWYRSNDITGSCGQDLVDFRFWGRCENWEVRESGRKRGWVRRWCSGVAGERKTEFGYFACKKSCLQVKCQEKWWVAVKRICGVEVCWLFAKDVWSYRMMKIRGRSSTLLGRQDDLVVLVADRLEEGPFSIRVSTFRDVFSMSC